MAKHSLINLNRFKLLTAVALVTSLSGAFAENMNQDKTLRVNLGVSFPLDPLHLKSMSEYDLSLALYRAWFTYDEGRRPQKGLIQKWSFLEKPGKYIFEIADVKWSDGTPVLPAQLIANLKRLAKSDTAYGKSLAAIVDIDSLATTTKKSFSFKTRAGKPSEQLFTQLGSVFLSIIHPNDFNEKGVVTKNSIFLGPYVVAHRDAKEFTMKKNEFFDFTNKSAPKTIVVRPPDPAFTLDKFLNQETWANYVQLNTMVAEEAAAKVLSSKFTRWTRGLDRVALMRPLGTSDQILKRRGILLAIAERLHEAPEVSHPLQVLKASSLQPIGYPLYQPIKTQKSTGKLPAKIRILSIENSSLPLFKQLIASALASQPVEIEWTVLMPTEFISSKWDSSGCDFVLFSFGVADPEPTTWLSLLFEGKFISYTDEEKQTFEQLMHEHNVAVQVDGYRELLNKIGSRGGYLPIVHGATVALGQPFMSFEKVSPLDETVDYSKIIFN